MDDVDDLDRFIAEAKASEHRSVVREWFGQHPDIAKRCIRGFHEQGYPVTKILRWLKQAHGYAYSHSPTETYLKAHKPDGG